MISPTKLTATVLLATISTSAVAQSKPDFGSIAMCAKLVKMPKGYKPIECDKRSPLRQCSFTLSSEKLPIRYLVDNKVVASKWLEYGQLAKLLGPFGLKCGDRESAAMAKVKKATGLTFESWTDENPGSLYYQSSDISCRGNAYNVRVFFQNGILDMVSVSSLPMN